MTGFSIDVEALRAQQQQQVSVVSAEPKTQNNAGGGSEPPMPTISSSSPRNDFSGWNLLCQAIDRVLFISYLAIILIFIASYLRRTALASQS